MKIFFACFSCCALFFSFRANAQTASAKPAATVTKPATPATVPAKAGTPVATAAKPVVQPVTSAPVASAGTAFLPAKGPGTVVLKTPAGVAAQANGIKTGVILVNVDTTIHSNPRNPLPDGKMAYLSIDISNINGTNQMEASAGKLMAWVYDKAGKQVPIADQVLKSIRADMEANTINDFIIKVPYRLKTDPNLYTIHCRWESPDKSKNFDILTTK